ncbi:hypothetical protein [Candidatus Sarmatiella mevalonica]|uniref:hypothetical protein n=1 Tax=Candidatus Sarmatiella mevalonica TaxID=2770581 RepID=UPI001924F6AA|nr:hypothetical protein [Candidatus Sarmatiella mevalonica]
MKYVRTCASTASPQLPSGVELERGLLNSKLQDHFFASTFTRSESNREILS